jgi:hypothetical protein
MPNVQAKVCVKLFYGRLSKVAEDVYDGDTRQPSLAQGPRHFEPTRPKRKYAINISDIELQAATQRRARGGVDWQPLGH